MNSFEEKVYRDISLREEDYIGSGDTVDVYSFGDLVIKKVRKGIEVGSDIFSEEECQYFSDFSDMTKVVSLPIAPYYEEKNYAGYVQKKCRRGEIRLFDEDSTVFVENMKLLRWDIQHILNPAWIISGDWHLDNLMYDSSTKKISLFDPGMYSVGWDMTDQEIMAANQESYAELGEDLFEVEFQNILSSCSLAAKATLLMRKDAKKYGQVISLFERDYEKYPLEFSTPASYALEYCNHQKMMGRLR